MAHSIATRIQSSKSRLFGSLICWLGSHDRLAPLVDKIGASRVGTFMLPVLVGPRRVYGSLDKADQGIRNLARGGHTHSDNIAIHDGLSDILRASDYAVMFHLRDLTADLERVVDWGGNCANVFHAYDRRLTFSPEVAWTVYDLPEVVASARQIGRNRHDARVHFTSEPPFHETPDLFLASGSLHYFTQDLDEILRQFPRLPRYVVINRTPLTDHETFATVQDAGSFWVSCLVRNKSAFRQSLERLGYICVDMWDAPELSLPIPFQARRSVEAYSGAFFRLAD